MLNLKTDKMELLELKAETNNGTFLIGNFETIEEAKKAVEIDKNLENAIYCISGKVEYVFDEEIIG